VFNERPSTTQISQIVTYGPSWFLDKSWIYWINKSKTHHFWQFIQNKPNFLCTNYRQSMVTFGNILYVEFSCMQSPSTCAWHAKQVFMPLNSPRTYHESFWQMTSDWWNFAKCILHPNFHPIWHLQACPPNMFQTLELSNVISPYNERKVQSPICHAQLTMNKKPILRPPTNAISSN